MCPFELRATPMPSPRYRFGGIVRKFGTDSYGMSGAVANAVARGGTCWADVGTARITLARASENPMKRFIAASVKFGGGIVTRVCESARTSCSGPDSAGRYNDQARRARKS